MILLSDMIQSLREELSQAQEQGRDTDFRFEFESVQLELSVAVTKTGAGKAGIQFWVIDAGGEYSKENSQTQKFTLLLKPASLRERTISGETTTNIGKNNGPN